MKSVPSHSEKGRPQWSWRLGLSAAAGAALPFLFLACGPAVPDVLSTTSQEVTEVGNAVTDASASVDESGGSTGNLAQLQRITERYARLAPEEFRTRWYAKDWIASASAATCDGASFGACSGNTVVRNYGGCTILGATFTGTVYLVWGGASAACHPTASGDTITRVPAYQITGPLGGTYTVSKVGAIGQQIRLSNFNASASRTQTFQSDGIRRVIKNAAGDVISDSTQSTVSAITITGTSRANRSMSGGTVRVLNNLTGSSCDFSPTNIRWSAGCNCPSSGSWAGTCDDGRTSSITLTGCGTGTVALGGSSEDLHFERCN
jgi:hypothetical protein